MMFQKLSEVLKKRGHEVFTTTRKYREVIELLKIKQMEAIIVGEHGGKELADKLITSSKRILGLAPILKRIKPDVSISFSSPEMARASYGLKIPHICINDSPHAESVAKLTIPLSEKLLTPKMIPKKNWVKYGISPKKIFQYNSLDPWAWLKDFKPDKRILKELGLVESKPILTFRTEESFAAYLLGKTKGQSLIIKIIKKVLEEKKDLQIVAIPRYNEQIQGLVKTFKNIVVCKTSIEAPSLLHYTSVFIGAGGTMSAEAAILGVPTISCYPNSPFIIEKFLIKRGLITRETNPKRICEKVMNILNNIKNVKEKQTNNVKGLVSTFEDPIEKIIKEVEKMA
jgi:predicted glycosyltransferase